MQPTKRFKKTLLTGALILGACNAFNVSADLFPVTAGAVPDVAAAAVAGYTELSFGQGIIGNKVGDTCSLEGATSIADAALLLDADQDGTSDAEGATYGDLTGAACVSGNKGTPMVIEIDGTAGATVSVTVADVVGTGWTYTPTAESCVALYSGDATADADSCASLAANTVTGVRMSLANGAGLVLGAENAAADFGFVAALGKARMVLAGSITIDSEIPAGSTIAENVIVQVTYE